VLLPPCPTSYPQGHVPQVNNQGSIDTLSIRHLAEVTPLLNLDNHTKACVLTHYLLSKSYLSVAEVSITFPQFKAKFDADMLFFQVCHFLGPPKS
jgi:hypothetical protein